VASHLTPGLAGRLEIRRPGGFSLDLDLEISAGETVALLGPNGSGKTTAVLALAGIQPLDHGRIEIGGRPVDDPAAGIFVPPEQRRVGVVFQDYVLFPHLSVLDNVAFGLRSLGWRRGPARLRAAEWLERLGMGELGSADTRHLSGGQSQRVALARALAIDPEALLLDEPLAALDVATRARLRRTLRQHLAAYPGPRLLITHDPAEAFLLADRVHVIEEGRITQSGTAAQIRSRPRTRYAADLAGINLLVGTAHAGMVTLELGGEVHIAEPETSGPVILTIHPRAISLHRQRPEGSPRNVWPTTVASIERPDDRVRVQLGSPLPLSVEITPDGARALDLVEGMAIWAAVKATEVAVEPDPI
jgi:molybdate transport system ATP-binding protein